MFGWRINERAYPAKSTGGSPQLRQNNSEDEKKYPIKDRELGGFAVSFMTPSTRYFGENANGGGEVGLMPTLGD